MIKECNFKYADKVCSISEIECPGEDNCVLYQIYFRLFQEDIIEEQLKKTNKALEESSKLANELLIKSKRGKKK